MNKDLSMDLLLVSWYDLSDVLVKACPKNGDGCGGADIEKIIQILSNDTLLSLVVKQMRDLNLNRIIETKESQQKLETARKKYNDGISAVVDLIKSNIK